MRRALLLILLAWVPCGARAQAAPGERLERVVIVMRHGVRSAMSTPEELGRYSLKPWPRFAVPPGDLTARGARAATLLGAWYRARYRALGLLGPDDCAVYYWANRTQRTEATAAAMAEGLSPGCHAPVHRAAVGPDPLFDAPLTPLAPPDPARMLAAIGERVGGDLAAWDRAHRTDLDAFEALIVQCRRTPCTTRERARVARRLGDTPIAMRLDADRHVTLTAPALQVAGIAESLVMAYADGLDFAGAGWRGIDAAAITRALQVHAAGIDLRTRTPEVGRQASAYLAARLLATLARGADGRQQGDALGEDAKIVVLSGHDGTVTMLAGLLGLNWRLPSYGPGEAAPGGGLIFERWHRLDTGVRIIRIRYVAQGLDQLRDLTPLTLEAGPETAALSMPGCGGADATCTLADFSQRIEAVTAGTRPAEKTAPSP